MLSIIGVGFAIFRGDLLLHRHHLRASRSGRLGRIQSHGANDAQGSGAAPNQSLRNILHAPPVHATSLLPCCGLIVVGSLNAAVRETSAFSQGVSFLLVSTFMLAACPSLVAVSLRRGRASHAQGRPREIGAVRLHAGPSVMCDCDYEHRVLCPGDCLGCCARRY